jgi:hypothetical protein
MRQPTIVRSSSSSSRRALGLAAVRPRAAASGQLVAAERRETGSVSWGVYLRYCQQIGYAISVCMLVSLLAGQGVFMAAEWWLSLWAATPPAQQRKTK